MSKKKTQNKLKTILKILFVLRIKFALFGENKKNKCFDYLKYKLIFCFPQNYFYDFLLL